MAAYNGTNGTWAFQADAVIANLGVTERGEQGVLRVDVDTTLLEAVAAGEAHCLALLSDGTVFGWGANNVGQATGTPTHEPPYFSKGRVVLSGQALSNIVAIAAAAQYSLGLRKDGTVVGWGDDWCHTTDVPAGLSNVVAIAPGLAITTNPAVAARFMPAK